MNDKADQNERRRRATLVGAGAVFLWGSLAVLTTYTGESALSDCRNRVLYRLWSRPDQTDRIARAAERAVPAKRRRVGDRGRRAVRISFPSLSRTEDLAAGSGQPDQLSLAPANRSVFRVFTGSDVTDASYCRRGDGLRRCGSSRHRRQRLYARSRSRRRIYGSARRAFVWTIYSLASSRLTSVPTDAIGAFCLVAAILSDSAHLVFETTVIPSTG